MTGHDYQELAMRTNDHNSSERVVKKVYESFQTSYDIGSIINASLGLSGEVGEFNDMIKKWVFHDKKDFDFDHAKKELGDILWYVALVCDSFNWNLDEILQINIDKLKDRYPEGFDTYLSNHRKTSDI